MARPIVVLTVGLGLTFAGCSSVSMFGDPSVVLDKGPAPSWYVQNGTAYDRATVDIGSAKTVIVPDTATVRRTREAGQVRLFMAKRLGFAGHPSKSMSIRETRKNMGCAIVVEGDAILIGTFGEYETIEGGADMNLVALIPEGLNVEQRKGLSGDKSAARNREEGPLRHAIGWKAVLDEPDPDRTAQEQKD